MGVGEVQTKIQFLLVSWGVELLIVSLGCFHKLLSERKEKHVWIRRSKSSFNFSSAFLYKVQTTEVFEAKERKFRVFDVSQSLNKVCFEVESLKLKAAFKFRENFPLLGQKLIWIFKNY
jgi:hypothetical protein